MCAGEQDHIYVVNCRNITDEEKETSISAPSIIKFDMAGNVVGLVGDQSTVPNSIHGCFVDKDKNVFVAGNADGNRPEICAGRKAAPSDRHARKVRLGGWYAARRRQQHGEGSTIMPSAIVTDPGCNGEIFIADGYGNRRAAVFDKDGEVPAPVGTPSDR